MEEDASEKEKQMVEMNGSRAAGSRDGIIKKDRFMSGLVSNVWGCQPGMRNVCSLPVKSTCMPANNRLVAAYM
jgi:hypothetical protein